MKKKYSKGLCIFISTKSVEEGYEAHDERTQNCHKALAQQYRRGRKGEKGNILDQFVKATGYDRCYARRLLRNHRKRIEMKPGLMLEGDVRLRAQRSRPCRYGEEVVATLK